PEPGAARADEGQGPGEARPAGPPPGPTPAAAAGGSRPPAAGTDGAPRGEPPAPGSGRRPAPRGGLPGGTARLRWAVAVGGAGGRGGVHAARGPAEGQRTRDAAGRAGSLHLGPERQRGRALRGGTERVPPPARDRPGGPGRGDPPAARAVRRRGGTGAEDG